MIVMTTPAQAEDVTASVKAVQGISSARPAARTASLVELQAVSTAQPGTEQSLGHGLRRAWCGGEVPRHVRWRQRGATPRRGGRDRARPGGDLPARAGAGLRRAHPAAALAGRAGGAGRDGATHLWPPGIAWLVFTQVLGFERLDAAPLLAFVFLVALGVDYNIFLVTRAKEEAAEHGSRAGMLRSLTATGGVITSAGILLAAVFAVVLGVLPLVVLAQLGVIIFIGVLLDTLVVRTVLVPRSR